MIYLLFKLIKFSLYIIFYILPSFKYVYEVIFFTLFHLENNIYFFISKSRRKIDDIMVNEHFKKSKYI